MNAKIGIDLFRRRWRSGRRRACRRGRRGRRAAAEDPGLHIERVGKVVAEKAIGAGRLQAVLRETTVVSDKTARLAIPRSVMQTHGATTGGVYSTTRRN